MLAGFAPPALAQQSARASPPPHALTPDQRATWRSLFTAIRTSDWASAHTLLHATPSGVLTDVARAELYLARGSPRVEASALVDLLRRAPELPQAGQIARLAETRDAENMPSLPDQARLVWQGSQPRRGIPDPVRGSGYAALDARIQPLIVADRPAEAEMLFLETRGGLSSEARTEFAQRIARAYFLIGDDASARRLASEAASGSGEWAVYGSWVAGLAAWRARDCESASRGFGEVASRSTDTELAAAGNYWAARADLACNHPERVQGRLRTAAWAKESFYGLIAASALGLRAPGFVGAHDYGDGEWRAIASKSNVRAAIALVEIGEPGLADTFIRHQARIGGAGDHAALLHLAHALDLAGTQFWLAHNAPSGASVNLAARYPAPDWRPSRGWRVDRNLVYAHALQESNFRTDVVSPAGAQGLMQVRPGTAGDIARARGEPFSRHMLNLPAANLEFGQTFLESLRDMSATGGLLPKVIAAYNAGPVPIAAWNGRRMDRGDPLLYIEAIPYWETRGYVPIVLRNYWIYEEGAGKVSASRIALAQGLWPRFPGMGGATGIRQDPGPPITIWRPQVLPSMSVPQPPVEVDDSN